MKTRTLRYLLLLAALVAVASDATAQWSAFQRRQTSLFRAQRRSNLSFNHGDGLSALWVATDLSNANSPGFTTHLQVGYTFLWRREAGFYTGLGVRYARSGFAADRVETEAMGYLTAYNNEGSATRSTHYTASIASIDERYSALFLELPLQLTYQQGSFFLDYGFKLMLPFFVRASCRYGETTIGVGRDIDGFGTHVDLPVELRRLPASQNDYTVGSLGGGGFAYPFYVALALNGGYRLAFDRETSLQIGFFVDFALNRTSVGADEGMVDFGDRATLLPVLQSNLSSVLRYMDCGVSIAYNFSFGKNISYRQNRKNPYTTHRRKISRRRRW